ncbi:MAG: hypothetical protein AAGH99_01760 [Planctomycetota bacterium]
MRSQVGFRRDVRQHRVVTGVGRLERIDQVRLKLGEQRHHPHATMVEVLGLSCVHDEAFAFPVDVGEVQGRELGRATQAAEPRQRQDQTPTQARTSLHHTFDRGAIDELLPLRVRRSSPREMIERLRIDHAVAADHPPHLLHDAGVFAAGRLAEFAVLDHPDFPRVGVAGRDRSGRAVLAEERQQVFARPFDHRSGAALLSCLGGEEHAP